MCRNEVILVFIFSISFAALADEKNEKCISVKGISNKLKCVQGKYEGFRKNIPQTGVELKERIEKKE